MSHKISLKEIADTLDVVDDEVRFYLNVKSGEIRPVTSEDERLLEADEPPEHLPEWQREVLPLAREVLESDDWLELPSKYDIHDWAIMERFCRLQPEPASDALLDAIHGRGAFRAFRDAVERHGLREAWFAHRQQALEKIAREWLEENQLPFE